ncbi:MAG: adenylate kinase [Nitrospirae bacterium]|jgi:adenylate kinase|nr:adenylate kinase [Nitrospirota bacterium]MCL5259916.1 adenylate kinase [Nitrospirota bacterium]
MFKSVVIFIGPPGVGKGTQASLLADAFSIPKFATGDLLREALKNNTPLGIEAKTYMDSGKLVPDQLVLDLIKGKIAKIPNGIGFILDGFPRTLHQAEGLDVILSSLCHNVGLAIEFSMDEEERIVRLTGRRLCPNCQRTYHILFAPPKKDSLCDYCSVELVQRADDNEDVIRKRSVIYWETTKPLLEYYRQKNILMKVDASSSIENVFSRIKQIFSELN